MIIKKYQGASEEEAAMKARDELGNDAVIMNVKTVNHKGLRRLISKNYVEVTAAIDEPEDSPKEKKSKKSAKREKSNRKEREVALQEAEAKSERESALERESILEANYRAENEAKTSAIEERLNNLAQLLERQMKDISAMKREEEEEEVQIQEEEVLEEPNQNSKIVNLVYEQLLNNEVTEANAREIMNEIDSKDTKLQLDDLLASVYQKIVLKLGQVKTIELSDNQPKVVFFIGPTGVGKTTTIAKLASKFKLEQKCKLAIVAADTYRIAAVEQIRTYANILSVPVDVVYNADDMKKSIRKYKDYDLIFVDTAGRSHKNEEQREDLKKLLEAAEGYDQEIYLVVSTTAKYHDLVKITQTYSDITNYRLIFTKIDETGALGNILNIRMLTKVPLSYTTFGQNVPDDIQETDAQFIAKQLLGGNE